MCLEAYFACDPDAEETYEVCTGQVSACVWTCCPYDRSVGGSGWEDHCGPSVEQYDEIEACKNACGLFADCLP
jgi:hypothetical protein